jgi:hypothetical protein
MLSYEFSFIVFATRHMSVSVCFNPELPDNLVTSPIFLLQMCQLLLVLLYAIRYLHSQPTFGKHVYPRQFEDDSLSAPEFYLTRTAQCFQRCVHRFLHTKYKVTECLISFSKFPCVNNCTISQCQVKLLQLRNKCCKWINSLFSPLIC